MREGHGQFGNGEAEFAERRETAGYLLESHEVNPGATSARPDVAFSLWTAGAFRTSSWAC